MISIKNTSLILENCDFKKNKNERLEGETFESFDTRVLSHLSVEEIQEKIGL